MNFNKTEQTIIASTLTVGAMLFIFNIFFIKYQPLNMISLIVAGLGIFSIEYRRYSIDKNIEARFPDFVTDIAENIKAGMTLPQAVKALNAGNYGHLAPDVKKIIAQIDWGVPFTDSLTVFAKRHGKNIQRSVSAILEAYHGGGEISNILDSTAKSMREIDKLRKERSSSVYSQVMTGYIIYIVFLGILVILKTYLVPSLGSLTVNGSSSASNAAYLYDTIFQWLIVIQGFFSGIVVGKLSEGRIIAGIKHSIILLIMGYATIILFM